MTTRTVVFAASAIVALLASGGAYAWSIEEDHGTSQMIRCQDGSTANIVQQADETWTVTSAGKNGKTGGSYAISGKAAQAACGE